MTPHTLRAGPRSRQKAVEGHGRIGVLRMNLILLHAAKEIEAEVPRAKTKRSG